MQVGRAIHRVLWLSCLLGACSDGFPPGFHDACDEDDDCRTPYRCLVWDDPLNGPVNVCSLTCTTTEQCPSLADEDFPQCGESRLCDDGVCAFEYCD